MSDIAHILEDNYKKYHHACWISPDPLQKLLNYECARDKEAVGLIAALYAYGRVKQILATLDKILLPLGASPAEFLRVARRCELPDVAHRFTSADDTLNILFGIGEILRRHGSIERAFFSFDGKKNNPCDRQGLLRCLEVFSGYLSALSGVSLPRPSGKSACKRWFLYLRWMLRKDEIDPGCWHGQAPACALIMPLDTHINRFGRELGLTMRKNADLKAAMEITDSLLAYCPQDPVKYDFSLTRAAYHNGGRLDWFFKNFIKGGIS